MKLETTGKEVGQARWRTRREDGQWSRTLDEVVIVLARRSPLSAMRVHTYRLELRSYCGDRLNSNRKIGQQQTEDDLDAGREVGVLTRSAAGLWTIDQGWWGTLDDQTRAAVEAFGDCFPTETPSRDKLPEQ